jgi:DNA-binding NtrC family response regulator
MRELREAMARTAPVPSPVLVLGESGTGKELVARELHRLSGREAAPFVAVNSAALPENLVESELFGHEKGAFTGADRLRRGAFERASGGTLFLDEIGDLPPAAQAKLLRVLETGEITRVGGEVSVEVDARVVAATHRDLDADIEEGRFRKDLLFRINVHTLRVPPLRDRPGDIQELSEHLLRTICSRLGLRPKRLAPATTAVLADYDWGRNNVRELRNVVERMAIAADGEIIEPVHVPGEIREAGMRTAAGDGSPDTPRDFRALRAEAERRIVRDALARNDGHVTRTAEELGLADHASLLKIMRRLGLDRD